MNNRALYWIALGVFALALKGEYQQGNLPLAHRVADHAGAVLCQVATKAEQTLALARVLTGRQELPVDDDFLARQQAEVDRVMAEHQADLEQAMALRQADLDRIQQRLERLHMVVDRAQMSKNQVFQLTQVKVSDATRRRLVVCPQTGTRVTVDGEPDVVVAVDVDDEQ